MGGLYVSLIFQKWHLNALVGGGGWGVKIYSVLVKSVKNSNPMSFANRPEISLLNRRPDFCRGGEAPRGFPKHFHAFPSAYSKNLERCLFQPLFSHFVPVLFPSKQTPGFVFFPLQILSPFFQCEKIGELCFFSTAYLFSPTPGKNYLFLQNSKFILFSKIEFRSFGGKNNQA